MSVNAKLRFSIELQHQPRLRIEPLKREVQSDFQDWQLPLGPNEYCENVPNIMRWHTAAANASQFFDRGSACFEAV
jgi:hypothetical protein